MLTITWDEPKRLQNVLKHRLDFADLREEFFLEAVLLATRDGRYMALGHFSNDVIAVVFVHLGTQGLSVISMRPASRKERRLL